MNNIIRRNVHRGFIRLEKRDYFSIHLLDITEQPVLVEAVSRDVIDVFDLSGTFICTAEINECKREKFPFNC
ncbi:TPA: Mu transposase C-terminal domain-containing protein [Haemophilus influenzae]